MTETNPDRLRSLAQLLRQAANAYHMTPHELLEEPEQWVRVGKALGASPMELEQALDLIEQQAAQSEQERRIDRHRRALGASYAPRSIARYVLQSPRAEQPYALAAVNPRLLQAVKIEIGKQLAGTRKGRSYA